MGCWHSKIGTRKTYKLSFSIFGEQKTSNFWCTNLKLLKVVQGGWFDGARRLSTRRASFFKVSKSSSHGDPGSVWRLASWLRWIPRTCHGFKIWGFEKLFEKEVTDVMLKLLFCDIAFGGGGGWKFNIRQPLGQSLESGSFTGGNGNSDGLKCHVFFSYCCSFPHTVLIYLYRYHVDISHLFVHIYIIYIHMYIYASYTYWYLCISTVLRTAGLWLLHCAWNSMILMQAIGDREVLLQPLLWRIHPQIEQIFCGEYAMVCILKTFHRFVLSL